MAFKMTLKTTNAAFIEAPDAANDGTKDEIARILRDVADKLERGYDSGACIDYNGNTVGAWEVR